MPQTAPMDPRRITPAGRRFDGADQRAPLREGLAACGQFGPSQTAGRFYPIACVALEITQRCNLDCTLCYLSDAAEMSHDVPMPVLLDRIDMVASHYGPGTSVQITGGDPTLRAIADLETLCQAIRARGLRACLMTNGIRATRPMLERLARAGLNDVAFHVDLTQERPGFASEQALNSVRAEYLSRAHGLGLRVLFNTTVFDGNLAEVPALARFFRDHADQIALISFQLQAETGRGVLRARPDTVSQQSVMQAVAQGMGTALHFDAAAVGHDACNRYAPLLVAGQVAASPFGDDALVRDVIAALSAAERPVDGHLDLAATAARMALHRPGLALRGALHLLRVLWRLRRGLVASRGRVHRLAILVHNFMDAQALDAERCRACVFMVLTEDGPLSMCVHNARRDHHVFAPARIQTADGPRWWSAATGRLSQAPVRARAGPAPIKLLKGRKRAATKRGRPDTLQEDPS